MAHGWKYSITPASGTLAGPGSYLGVNADGTFVLATADTSPDSADVVGPDSATNNAIVRFNLTTGKLIQDSGITISDTNNVLPAADNTNNLGSGVNRWENIYGVDIHTADLHLKNDRGNYTIIEEEEYLSIRNNKTGKLYKFVLEEIVEEDE